MTITVVVNGRARLVRAVALIHTAQGLPRWLADVDGAQAEASTMDAALLAAAHAAESQPQPKEKRA